MIIKISTLLLHVSGIVYNSVNCNLRATSTQSDYSGNYFLAGITNCPSFIGEKETLPCHPKKSGYIMKAKSNGIIQWKRIFTYIETDQDVKTVILAQQGDATISNITYYYETATMKYVGLINPSNGVITQRYEISSEFHGKAPTQHQILFNTQNNNILLLSDSASDDFAIFNFRADLNKFRKVNIAQISGQSKKFTAIGGITLGFIAGGNLDDSDKLIFCPLIARFDDDLVQQFAYSLQISQCDALGASYSIDFFAKDFTSKKVTGLAQPRNYDGSAKEGADTILLFVVDSPDSLQTSTFCGSPDYHVSVQKIMLNRYKKFYKIHAVIPRTDVLTGIGYFQFEVNEFQSSADLISNRLYLTMSVQSQLLVEDMASVCNGGLLEAASRNVKSETGTRPSSLTPDCSKNLCYIMDMMRTSTTGFDFVYVYNVNLNIIIILNSYKISNVTEYEYVSNPVPITREYYLNSNLDSEITFLLQEIDISPAVYRDNFNGKQIETLNLNFRAFSGDYVFQLPAFSLFEYEILQESATYSYKFQDPSNYTVVYKELYTLKNYLMVTLKNTNSQVIDGVTTIKLIGTDTLGQQNYQFIIVNICTNFLKSGQNFQYPQGLITVLGTANGYPWIKREFFRTSLTDSTVTMCQIQSFAILNNPKNYVSIDQTYCDSISQSICQYISYEAAPVFLTFSFTLRISDLMGSQDLLVKRRINNCPTMSNYIFTNSTKLKYFQSENPAQNYIDITHLMGVDPNCIKSVNISEAVTPKQFTSSNGYTYCAKATEGCNQPLGPSMGVIVYKGIQNRDGNLDVISSNIIAHNPVATSEKNLYYFYQVRSLELGYQSAIWYTPSGQFYHFSISEVTFLDDSIYTNQDEFELIPVCKFGLNNTINTIRIEALDRYPVATHTVEVTFDFKAVETNAQLGFGCVIEHYMPNSTNLGYSEGHVVMNKQNEVAQTSLTIDLTRPFSGSISFQFWLEYSFTGPRYINQFADLLICGGEEVGLNQDDKAIYYVLKIEGDQPMTLSYDHYQHWFKILPQPQCIIKKYSFCPDSSCTSKLEASKQVEYTLKSIDIFNYDSGFTSTSAVFILYSEYQTNKINIGDVIQIKNYSFKVNEVWEQDRYNQNFTDIKNPLQRLVQIVVDFPSNSSQSISSTSLVKLPEPPLEYKIQAFLTPSLTLTKQGSVYLQAETKGLVTGTKQIEQTNCVAQPISFNQSQANITLGFNQGIQKFDIQGFVINSCGNSCPIETFKLKTNAGLGLSNTIVKVEMLAIRVDAKVSQVLEMLIEPQFNVSGNYSECGRLQTASLSTRVVICGSENLKLANSQAWNLEYFNNYPLLKTVQYMIVEEQFKIQSEILECLDYKVSFIEDDKYLEVKDFIYFDLENNLILNLIKTVPNLAIELQVIAESTYGKVNVTRPLKITYLEVPKNQAPYFVNPTSLKSLTLSVVEEDLLAGKEDQYFIYDLPQAYDIEGNDIMIVLQKLLPCGSSCISISKSKQIFSVQIDKTKLSSFDIGTNYLTLNIYDKESIKTGLVNRYDLKIEINFVSFFHPPTEDAQVQNVTEEVILEESIQQLDEKANMMLKDTVIGAKAVFKQVMPDWLKQMSIQEFSKRLSQWQSPITAEQDVKPLLLKIDSISRSGQIQLGFNQNIMMPDFIQDAKTGRLLKALESIPVENFIGIQFVMKSDLEPKNLQFYMTLDDWQLREVILKVNFVEPLLVSKGNLNDQVIVTIITPALFRATQGGKPLDNTNAVMTSEFPTQVPRDVDADSMAAQQGNVQSAIYAIIIVQIIASIFLKGGMDELLSLFFSLQIVIALRQFETSLPANIDMFSERIRQVIMFEFLKPEVLLKLFLPEFDLANYLGFTKDQMESSLLFSCGAYISIAIILMMVGIFLSVLKKVPKYREKAKRIIEKLKKAQFWSGILKSQTISFMPLLCGISFQAKKIIDGQESGRSRMLFELLFMFPFILILPVSTCWIITKYRKTLNSVEFQQRFGFLTQGLRLTRFKLTKYYYPIFIYRRFILVILPILFNGRGYLQIMIQIHLSYWFILFHIYERTHLDKSDFFLSILNECFIMICNYHLICFTWFVESVDLQFSMGYSLENIIILVVAINISIMVWKMKNKAVSQIKKKNNLKAFHEKQRIEAYQKFMDQRRAGDQGGLEAELAECGICTVNECQCEEYFQGVKRTEKRLQEIKEKYGIFEDIENQENQENQENLEIVEVAEIVEIYKSKKLKKKKKKFQKFITMQIQQPKKKKKKTKKFILPQYFAEKEGENVEKLETIGEIREESLNDEMIVIKTKSIKQKIQIINDIDL